MSLQKLRKIAGTRGEAGNPARGSWRGVGVLEREPRSGQPPCTRRSGACPLKGGAGAEPGGRGPLSQTAPRARRQFGHVPGHVAPVLAIFAASSQGPPPPPEPPSPGAAAPTTAAMNIFRLTGDLSHLAAIVILLLKIWKTRSCAGERRARPGQGSGAGPGRLEDPPTPVAPRSAGLRGPDTPPWPAWLAAGPRRACDPRSGLALGPGRGFAALGPAPHLVRSRT